jgi:hypothetical protein
LAQRLEIVWKLIFILFERFTVRNYKWATL